MAYELVVTFSGLCVVVPKEEGRTLWGLLVDSHAHGGGAGGPHQHAAHIEEHLPVVIYGEGQTRPGSTEYGQRQYRRIDKLTNVIGPRPGDDVRPQFRRIPGNMSRVHGKHPPPAWFNAGGNNLFAARVQVNGTSGLQPNGGVLWEYGGQTVRLQTELTCVVPVDDDRPLTVRTTQGALVLHPIGSQLQVEFHCVTADQLPGGQTSFPPIPVGAPPLHWEAYRDLLQVPASDAERPRYVSGNQGATMAGINPFACLTIPLCPDDDPTCG